MGSVAKVRKRVEVIGGSARAGYRKSQRQPYKFLNMFPFLLQFCPINRHPPISSEESQAYQGMSAISGSDEWRDNSGNGSNCFTLFCCPARQSSDSVLAPISEHRSLAASISGNSDKGDSQGCWEGVFGGFFHRSTSRQHHTSERSSTKGSFDFDSSTSDDNNVLNKEDYDEIERHVERTLKHSTSSLIHYGHKDVVYALKSIHLDRVSSTDFMKELKNEGKRLLRRA